MRQVACDLDFRWDVTVFIIEKRQVACELDSGRDVTVFTKKSNKAGSL